MAACKCKCNCSSFSNTASTTNGEKKICIKKEERIEKYRLLLTTKTVLTTQMICFYLFDGCLTHYRIQNIIQHALHTYIYRRRRIIRFSQDLQLL